MSRPTAGQRLDARPARGLLEPPGGARRSACVAVAAAVGLFSARDAHAVREPPQEAMALQLVRGPGAEGCPDETDLRAEVARALGTDPFRDDAPQVLVVRVARDGPELTASLALRDREGVARWADGFGTRSGCKELMSGVALAIVAHVMRAAEPRPPPIEPTAPEPMPPSAAPPSPARRTSPATFRRGKLPRAPSGPAATAASPERVRFETGLGTTLALGITPGPAAGVTLAAGARWSDWSAAVEGRGLVSLGKEIGGMFMNTAAFTAAAVGCYRGRLLFGCGLATLGTVRFTPRSPWTMRSRSDALFGFGARLGAEWPFSRRWSVLGYAEAIWIADDAAFDRSPYETATPAPLIWTSPPLGGAFGLGITATY